MFYFIGLGLSGVRDITLKGIELIKSCDKIYMDNYTSILIGTNKGDLEKFYGKSVKLLNRELIEESEELTKDAHNKSICFLVVGDPLAATTHSELILRLIDANIPYRIIHNASIMTAVGSCGLQLYRFGEIVSIVAWLDTTRPTSFFDKIVNNLRQGLHTLCLLDIKMQEKSVENIIKNRPIYEPPFFLTINQAINQLLEISEMDEKRTELPDYTLIICETKCFGLARMGSDTEIISSGTMSELRDYDFGPEMHSLVIAGDMHDLEMKFYDHFHCKLQN